MWGPDPLLTALGETQADEAHAAWKAELPSGVPAPEKCFASPHKRALDTWKRTFDASSPILREEHKRVLILEVRLSALTSGC